MKSKVAIIAGAGPAGLTAAYELLKRTDVEPIIFEATDMIGGIAQTYNYKGNRIDIGGHRFYSRDDRVMEWWLNIMPPQSAPAADTAEKKHEIDYANDVSQDFLCDRCVPEGATAKQSTVTRHAPDPEKEDLVMLQRPRLSRIFYRRAFFPYPISMTWSTMRKLGIWNVFLIGLSYIYAQIFPCKDETYLDAFLTNRFGARLFRTFFRDYTHKVWGVPCSQIPADWGNQRIKGLSLKRAVMQSIKDLMTDSNKKAQKDREITLITRFYYPKLGPGQMWEEVAAQIKSCGGKIHMRHKVLGIELENGKVRWVTVENLETGEKQRLECDYFFSTMPIRTLMRNMTPAPPEPVLKVSDGLLYRDFITVGLLLNKLHVLERGKEPAKNIPDNWIYVQEGDVRVGRVQLFNNWSPYMVADRSKVWIGLEYFVNEGDDLWSKPDKEMVDFGAKEMEKIGFLKTEDLVDGCVIRMPKAYPAYFGTFDKFDTVKTYLDSIPNLFLIGRNGMHCYNSQDHSMLTSMMAVDMIEKGETDKAHLWMVMYHDHSAGKPVFKKGK